MVLASEGLDAHFWWDLVSVRPALHVSPTFFGWLFSFVAVLLLPPPSPRLPELDAKKIKGTSSTDLHLALLL